MTKKLKENNIPYWCRSATGNSLLLYLLNITFANPLPPHYICPICGTIIWKDSCYDGFDLPEKACSCGAFLWRDGHNLSSELFWGCDLDSENLRKTQQTMHIDVPANHFAATCDFLTKHPAFTDFTADKPEHGRTMHIGKISVQKSSILPEQSRKFYKPITTTGFVEYTNNKLLRHSVSLDFLQISHKIFEASSFSELIRLLGLSHGTWSYSDTFAECYNMSGDFVSITDFPFEDAPVFYDDVFDKLLSFGFLPKDAWKEADNIHFGKGLSEKAMMAFPTDKEKLWIESIMYLFPRAHEIEYFLLQARLHMTGEVVKE